LEFILILILALILDYIFGEPKNNIHPVAWLGKTINVLERPAAKLGRKQQLIFGILIVILLVFIITIPLILLLEYLAAISTIIYVIVGAILLKLTFSLRGLGIEAGKIMNLLEKNQLDQTRFELRALVSRDTKQLDKPHLISCVVESVGESIGDSFVSPLFFFLLLGVPGAVAFRIISTFDSMIGYRGHYEYLGKFAAKTDDVLNFIPARLTAIGIVVVAFFRGEIKRTWQVLLMNKNKTDSPNAGWPISAMAGVLGVQLEKIGQYKIGQPLNELKPQTIKSAIVVSQETAFVWVIICLIIGVIYNVY
jgi:adenosylcobinamide-phosphate synthase